jgi:hypothetical protein
MTHAHTNPGHRLPPKNFFWRNEPEKYLKTKTNAQNQNPSLNPVSAFICVNLRLIPTSSPSHPTPAPSAPAPNSPAHSNSPTPATPHPSAALPDIPMAKPRSSSGLYSPHPDPWYSSRNPSKSRRLKSPRSQPIEETFFLSSTKTSVVINKSLAPQYMEDSPLTSPYVALSLQLRIQRIAIQESN